MGDAFGGAIRAQEHRPQVGSYKGIARKGVIGGCLQGLGQDALPEAAIGSGGLGWTGAPQLDDRGGFLG